MATVECRPSSRPHAAASRTSVVGSTTQSPPGRGGVGVSVLIDQPIDVTVAPRTFPADPSTACPETSECPRPPVSVTTTSPSSCSLPQDRSQLNARPRRPPLRQSWTTEGEESLSPPGRIKGVLPSSSSSPRREQRIPESEELRGTAIRFPGGEVTSNHVSGTSGVVNTPGTQHGQITNTSSNQQEDKGNQIDKGGFTRVRSAPTSRGKSSSRAGRQVPASHTCTTDIQVVPGPGGVVGCRLSGTQGSNRGGTQVNQSHDDRDGDMSYSSDPSAIITSTSETEKQSQPFSEVPADDISPHPESIEVSDQDPETSETMMRYERELGSGLMNRGGLPAPQREEVLHRYSLFRSTTTSDLRTENRARAGQAAAAAAAAAHRRGGSANNVNANNYWWMHSRDAVNPYSGSAAAGGSHFRSDSGGGYREIHVTLPSTTGVNGTSSDHRSTAPSPGPNQRGRLSPSKQRLLGMTRGPDYDCAIPGSKFKQGHPRGAATNGAYPAGAGRSFGATVNSPTITGRPHENHTNTVPTTDSHLHQGAGRRGMPTDTCFRTSSAVINGDPMSERHQGLILPSQTGAANDKVHFQVVVQKGKSQKRFQISTRLEDIRRARETNHHQRSTSGSYRHLVTDPREPASQGNFSYGRGGFGTMAPPGGTTTSFSSHTPSPPTRATSGHSHRVLEELAARYATLGEQEYDRPKRDGPTISGQATSNSSWGKHGGIIKYDNLNGIDTIASSLREERPTPNTLRTQNTIPGILKRNSQREDYLTEKPEVGWQQKIDGANLTWSDYFCVTTDDNAPTYTHIGGPITNSHLGGHTSSHLGGHNAGGHFNTNTNDSSRTVTEHHRPGSTVRQETELTMMPSARSVNLKGNIKADKYNRKQSKRSVRFSTSNKIHEYDPVRSVSDSDSVNE